MDGDDKKSILDFGAWLDIDAPTVARPVVHPLTWHDFSCLRTTEGMCAWSAPRCEACNGTEVVWGTAMDPCACRGLVAMGRRLTYARIPWAYRDVSINHLAPEGGVLPRHSHPPTTILSPSAFLQPLGRPSQLRRK